MIASSRYVVGSRNEFEEISNVKSITEENLKLVVRSNLCVGNKEGRTIMVFCDEASMLVTNAISDGTLLLAEIVGNFSYSKIYQDDQENILIQITSPIPEKLLFQWNKIVYGFNPAAVFATTFSSQILSTCVEGDIRYLVTTDLLTALKTTGHRGNHSFQNNIEVINALMKFRSLESGNVMTGMIAAIMSFYEVRKIPACSIICSRRAAISFNALRSFESCLPLLYASLRSKDVMNRPATEVHKKILTKDPFATRTENIYT
mmetsp:Transcript_19393/g.18740  ORF Transcript_19393/g.18740 Transcript_19393/m.18740 type:complete len:261 (+) Transcript_19393:111-893(+)